MATLTGKQIANSYKQLLQIGSDNTGITTTLQAVQDGNGNNSPLQLTNSTLNIDGTLQLNGVALTADASALNAITDLTGITGIVAMNAGSALGRTLTAGAGIDITNSDGTAGNPTVALSATGVTSASYGPLTSFEVNQYGQVTSATAVSATLSVPNIYATDFYGERLHLSDRLSVTGDSRLVGAVSVDSNITVDGNAVVKGSANITGDVSSSGNIKVIHVSASGGSYVGTVSAGFFVGDGSGLINVPSVEGGTVKFIKAGTGIKITVDGAVSSSIPVSGTILVSADQNFGTVSVSTALAVTGDLLISGVTAATVNDVAAVSALTQTNLDSITSINTVVANVSALTSVNAAAITSINTVVDNLDFATSAELAAVSVLTQTNLDSITSINTVVDAVSAVTSVNAAAITSINTVVANVSALTSVNTAAITSINTVVEAVSALTSVNTAAITSINTVVEAVSALTSVNTAAITSINTVVEAVSVVTSVNAAAITSVNTVITNLSATLATSIANHLPLAGGTLTGTVSGTDFYVSAVAIGVDALLGKELRIGTAAVADIVSLTDAVSIAVDFNTGQNFAITLAGNRTLENPTNCVAGQVGSIFIVQDGTGSRTLAFGSNWDFPDGTAPVISTSINAVDRLDYIVHTSTDVHGLVTKAYS
jgi:hypothetical protein